MSRKSAASRRRQRGAALLLLLAMTSVGAAAVLISALSHDSVQQQQRRNLLTLARMAQAREALVGYAATNGRLPRPAVSATDGNESPAQCATEQDCTGFLPWVTLGVDGADAWGKVLRYSVTPVYTQSPVRRISAIATKTVQGRDASGEYYYLAGQSTCDPGAQCAPLVLLSHGRGNFGTSTLGVAQPNTGRGNVDEQQNAETDLHFISRVANADAAAPGGEFDDVVLAVPLPYLYKQMAAAHRLP